MAGDDALEDAEVLSWTVRLWETAPQRRWIILAVALGTGCLGYAAFQLYVMAAIGFLAIVGSTSEYWLPLHYRLDEKGASVRCGISVTAIDWNAVKRQVDNEVGLRLSPLAEATRLAPFRGVFLRYAGNREAILEYVQKRGGDDARVLEQGAH